MQRAIQLTVLSATLLTIASAAEPPADLVLTGANVITMDWNRPRAEAVACRAGRIVAIGTVGDVTPYIGDKTRVISLDGLTVVPGFIEGHGHFVSLGQSKITLDLTTAKNWKDVVDLVGAAARTARKGEWIIGRGWHQAKWNPRPDPNVDGYPVHTELTKVTPDNPVLLIHRTGHASIANDLAMKMAGITTETPDPKGGEILRDEQQAPIGVFRENATALLSKALAASRSTAELDRAVELATDDCLRNGITSFQDAGASFATIDRFQTLADEGRLIVRMWVMINESNRRLRESLAKYRMINQGDHRLTVRGIKLFKDGALGSSGAWLLKPYNDNPDSTGLETTTLASLRETAALAIAHDMQLCVHAIGDRANRQVLDLFEATFKQFPSEQSRRWRIEHAQHLSPQDIPRFAQLGVIASMQAVHCTSDAPFVIARLGEKRAREGAYAWYSLLKTGAIIANGTDAPVENVSPLKSFYAAVTRRLPDGTTFFPEQRMTREQALRSYTLDAAYAAFEENTKGALTPGKLADMTILSRDILRCAEEEIPTTQVVYTVLGGDVVYSVDGEATR